MIVFRYTKLHGAEFISHLDTLRHIGKTLKRAKIDVKFSNGFNHHALIFMSSPIGCGMKSYAEYCYVETDEKAETFIDKFNEKSNKGIRCLEAFDVDKKIGVATVINSAVYSIKGINKFDVAEFMAKKEYFVIGKKDVVLDVRDRIISLKFVNNELIAELSFGNINLRPDVLARALVKDYGGEIEDMVKLEARVNNSAGFETILRQQSE